MQLFFRRNLCDRSEIDGDVPRKVCMQHQSLAVGLHDLAAQMVTVFQGDLIGVYRRHECQAQNGDSRYAFTQHCYLQLSESLTTQLLYGGPELWSKTGNGHRAAPQS